MYFSFVHDENHYTKNADKTCYSEWTFKLEV
jgi:hypothetical protein